MKRWSAGVVIAVLLGLTVAFGVNAARAAENGPPVRLEVSVAMFDIAIDSKGVAVALDL
jgi:hypothetical protein